MNDKGLNRVATAKGVNTNKTHEDILNVQMNSRAKITTSWFDVFIYKYIRCGYYQMFKGPKYYQGKIIYEAEQRIKNEADFGNIVSSSRKSRIMSQTMLDSNTYTLMKYQQCKFIDVVEQKDFRKIRHTDLDSQINNNASVDDVRDFLCVQNIDRDNTATSKKDKKTKGKSTKQPQETRHVPGAESEL